MGVFFRKSGEDVVLRFPLFNWTPWVRTCEHQSGGEGSVGRTLEQRYCLHFGIVQSRWVKAPRPERAMWSPEQEVKR